MDVHHHSHTSRKKWTHYFWEFLMLFLAVFCGFLAEYQLEHKIEKDREKQYIKSFIEDLESDTTQLNYLLNLFDAIIRKEDTLKQYLLEPDIIKNPSKAYPYVGFPLDGYGFHRSERTIQQLKNAGGLRLINSIEVSNKINEYDELCRKSDEISQVTIDTYHNYAEILNRVCYANLIGFPYSEKPAPDSAAFKWLTTDPRELLIFHNIISNFQWVKRIYSGQLKDIKVYATGLISFLRNEYRIKK